uniref:Uncharacterized protein n=1 Tax=Anguilla anguilla TaxID=7936 RepID=A0A0E9XC55_ANGAN
MCLFAEQVTLQGWSPDLCGHFWHYDLYFTLVCFSAPLHLELMHLLYVALDKSVC